MTDLLLSVITETERDLFVSFFVIKGQSRTKRGVTRPHM